MNADIPFLRCKVRNTFLTGGIRRQSGGRTGSYCSTGSLNEFYLRERQINLTDAMEA